MSPLRASAFLLTERASRLLFEALIDYAGLYPPAELSMPVVVRNFAHYRAGGAGWMLGRFICPATALELFSVQADPLLPRDAGAIPWRLAATGSGDVQADLAQIAAFNERHRVCFEECGALVDSYEVKAASLDDIARIDAATPHDLATYIEVAVDDQLESMLDAIAATGRRAKLRTGGIVATAFPAAAQVVRFLRACTDRALPAKATAGLHHPLPGVYRLTYQDDAPTGRMFGFLPVLLAATHIAQGGSDAEALALLETGDPAAIRFADEQVTWEHAGGVVTFSRQALAETRERGLVSIGSCSFTEPVDESRALGWL